MASQSIEALVEGGKATAAPPLGPALGPLGVNIGKVIAEINKKTEDFKGMQVPITVSVNMENKEFSVSVGTPPASALIKKEAGIEKGSGKPKTELVADLKIEQIIKISKMKKDSLLGKTTKARVKEIIGTCVSMGIMVEGVTAKESLVLVDKGQFDAKIKAEKTELSQEEIKMLQEEKKRLQDDLAHRKAELEAKAKEIVALMEGKEPTLLRAKLREAGLPDDIIKQFAPQEASKTAPPKK
jgi:large subunit ribosomal protein L11